jgi:hypothetical protein
MKPITVIDVLSSGLSELFCSFGFRGVEQGAATRLLEQSLDLKRGPVKAPRTKR